MTVERAERAARSLVLVVDGLERARRPGADVEDGLEGVLWWLEHAEWLAGGVPAVTENQQALRRAA